MKTIAKLGVLPVAAFATVTAGTLMNAGVAEAAALTGDFQFSSGFTTTSLSSNMLSFNPDPGSIMISDDGTVDSFSAFNSTFAEIDGPVTFSPFSAPNPFITFAGGLDFFTLESSTYSIAQSGANLVIDVIIDGFFTSSTGDTSDGEGNLSFQVNNMLVADAQALLDGGGSLNKMAFSGGAFTSVPEPTTMLGLGLVAGAGFLASRRKQEVEA